MPYYNSNGNRFGGHGPSSGQSENKKLSEAKRLYSQYSAKYTDWLSSGADEEMVKFAESIGEQMANNGLKSAQFRNIFGEVKRIQVGGFEKNKTSFFLLKPKMAYAAGRNDAVGTYLLKLVLDDCFAYVKDARSFQYFCDLLEAILAYHRTFSNE